MMTMIMVEKGGAEELFKRAHVLHKKIWCL